MGNKKAKTISMMDRISAVNKNNNTAKRLNKRDQIIHEFFNSSKSLYCRLTISKTYSFEELLSRLSFGHDKYIYRSPKETYILLSTEDLYDYFYREFQIAQSPAETSFFNAFIPKFKEYLSRMVKMKPYSYWWAIFQYCMEKNLEFNYVSARIGLERFCIVDNCFAYILNNMQYLILEYDYLKIFEANNLPVPSVQFVKKLLKYYYQSLKKESPVPQEAPSSGLFYFNQFVSSYLDLPIGRALSFPYNNIGYPVKRISLFDGRYTMHTCSSQLVDSLFQLSGGDLDKLDLLAIFFADLLMSNKVFNHLYILEYAKGFEPLCNFFIKLLNGRFSHPLSLGDLGRKENSHCMLGQLNGFFAHFITESQPLKVPNYEDVEYIKKVIYGKPYQPNGKCTFQKQFYNKLPVVYFATGDQNAKIIRNLFGGKIITIPNCTIPFGELLTGDYDWIKTAFTLYGLFLQSSDKDSKPKSTVSYNLSESVFDLFIQECCDKSEEIMAYASQLYDSYIRLCNSSYDVIPYTYIKFNKQMRALGTFEYKRPHTSRKQPNQYAFIGICVNEEKLSNYIQRHTSDLFNQEKRSAFTRRLEEITQAYRSYSEAGSKS